MPVVIAALIRSLIMAIASGAIVTGAQNLLDGSFKELAYEIKDSEGLTEQEAIDVVGNILLDLAINSATIMAILRGNVGVRVAQFFGFTSRGFAKATLTPAAEAVVTKLVVNGGKGLAARWLKRLLYMAGGISSIVWLTSALANIIEPGIYKPEQTNAIYEKLGIPFRYPTTSGGMKPGPFSSDSSVTFEDLYKSLETVGTKGIDNPIARQSQVFNKTNLSLLIDGLYGQEVAKGNAPSVKEMIIIIGPYLIGGTKVTSVASSSPSYSTPSTLPKVYTGIVTQGILGKAPAFESRPDDLIESLSELQQAASNNLAAFLQSLPGRVVYELKIVASVITKDGFKQTGTVQELRDGSYADGRPKYKTVYNKFAVIDVYVLTDKGVRSKINTIVLGPTNSAKLSIGTNQLRSIETDLTSLVSTSSIDDIKGIETSNPVTVTTPPASGNTSLPATPTVPVETSASSASIPIPSAPTAGQNASTLFEWFESQGMALPSVAQRAPIYAALGLGQAAYYTGSGEQNSKMLSALKALPIPSSGSTGGEKNVQPTSTSKASVSSSSAKKEEPKKEEKKEEKKDTPSLSSQGIKSVVTKSNGDKVTTYKDGRVVTTKKQK
jgi:hypothetical protein